MRPFLLICALAFAAPALTACGFQPLYAETADGEAPGLSNVALAGLTAADSIDGILRDALDSRMNEGASARYDLLVEADERADQLAVQLDASVTRFNYRLDGKYTLVDRETGARLTGRATSYASFNVVASQYSTLFAETAAREKAANQLVLLIERDILLKLAARRDDK